VRFTAANLWRHSLLTVAAPVSTPVFAIRDDDGVRLMVDEHGAAPSLVTMPVPVPPAVANCASMMLPDGGHRGRRHLRRRVEIKL
jgi:hypothetical protein